MPRSSRRSRKSAAQFEVLGLSSFNRQLRHMAGDLPGSVKQANLRAARKIVVAGKAEATTRQEKKAAQSLRATRTATFAGVRLGSSRIYAFALGAEFGAKRYKQFREWRGNQFQGWSGGPGYFLHPAIRKVGRRVLDEYWREIKKISLSAFPE